ncbi:macro domain-containing protein [soil metagenome]
MRIEIVEGDLLRQPVETIVNAANTRMRGGGGVDGAIHAAAGFHLLDELRRVAPRGAETAEVVVTGGHGTGFQHIFHVAGPRWKGGDQGEGELLAASYRNVCLRALELGVRSIAFPSISTGAYGYPVRMAAPIALENLRSAEGFERLIVALKDREAIRVYAELSNEP